LEYASEVWDNCGQEIANCNRLEKIQIEAARIVTGLSIYASFDSILLPLKAELIHINNLVLLY
jgi:hypothetical protein